MKRLQLVVDYLNGQTRYYPVSPVTGWNINPADRCIVIGKFPRKYIPLDTVAAFDIEEVPPCPDMCHHVVAVIGLSDGLGGSEAGASAPAAPSEATDDLEGTDTP